MESNQKKFLFSDNSELLINSSLIVFTDNWGTLESKGPIGFGFGILPIDFYELRIGLNYKTRILTEDNKVITIPLISYLGIKRKQHFNLQNEIVDTLWDTHFKSIYFEMIEKYNSGINIEFDSKYKLTDEGLLILSRNDLIRYHDMRIDKRFDHFIVNSISNPKLYTNVFYLEIWNSSILLMILKRILDNR